MFSFMRLSPTSKLKWSAISLVKELQKILNTCHDN
uniref:Uncharacterized protein n=1 Tax=Anguilla anguilla TaxID=7936 RepID=A0A0E9UTF6_ANGAN